MHPPRGRVRKVQASGGEVRVVHFVRGRVGVVHLLGRGLAVVGLLRGRTDALVLVVVGGLLQGRWGLAAPRGIGPVQAQCAAMRPAVTYASGRWHLKLLPRKHIETTTLYHIMDHTTHHTTPRHITPHRLGAVGSGTPAVHCCTAGEQWAVDLLQYTATLLGSTNANYPYPVVRPRRTISVPIALPACIFLRAFPLRQRGGEHRGTQLKTNCPPDALPIGEPNLSHHRPTACSSVRPTVVHAQPGRLLQPQISPWMRKREHLKFRTKSATMLLLDL